MRNLLIIALLVCHAALFGQTKTVTVSSKIKEVTVFLAGAEVNRYGSATIPSGRSILLFEGLTGTLNPKSIQAQLTGEARIISISYERDFLRPIPPTKRNKEINDSLKVLQYQLEDLDAEIQVLEHEKKVLLDNNKRLGQREGVTTNELQLAADFYQKRLMSIYKDLLKLNRNKKDVQAVKSRLVQQQNQLRSKLEMPTYNAKVMVESGKSYASTIQLNYAVTTAAWTPRYNLRSNGPGTPVQIDYLALVANRTGIDWNNVDLILSTGDPSKSMAKPTMDTWTLNYGNRFSFQNEGRLNLKRSANNYLYDKSEESDGYFEPSLQQSEVDVSELSVEFAVKDPYTVKGDGTVELVNVNEHRLEKVAYEHFAIPKMEKDAFLIAKVTEWEKLNLVDGPANVYFNEKYVGESYIETRYSADTLEISLGRDPKVNVVRVKKEDNNAKKIIGLNRKVTLTYELSIRNTHSENIQMEVWDQVPVSQESDIEVTVHEISGASKDPLNGKLEWKLDIPPATTKKLLVSFSVKYPKNKDLDIRKSRKVAAPMYF